jgi:Plasmid pRiA4b ORF-3-like protein
MAKKKQIKPVGTDTNANLLADQAVALAEFAANALVAAERLRIKSKPVEGLLLNHDERAALTLLPTLSAKVKKSLAKPDGAFTVAEVAGLVLAVAETIIGAGRNQQVELLLIVRKLMECLQANIVMPVEPMKAKKLKLTDLLYQLKITLRESQPPIWRRIQVKDCTLDELHAHIQTVMGWTNSHLHHFKIGEQFYGDPMIIGDNFDEFGYADSTTTNLSDIIPENRRKFRFLYEYDFGDSWYHEILFEGYKKMEPGKKYPFCLEGERACPPEDCGGIWGYPNFIDAIENPNHERHEEILEWIGGSFDPEAFDPLAATKAMKKGLGDWRKDA